MNLTEVLNRMTTGRAIIIGFLFAGIYYFLFFDKGYNLQSSSEALKQQQIQLSKQLKDAEGKIARALEYKKSGNELDGTLNRLLSTIPERFGIQDLMKIVSNEAKVAGSNLVSITPRGETGRPNPNPEFQELALQIDITGSFAQHMVFLSNLTKVNQILTVQKMDMKVVGNPAPGEPAMVKMLADIVAYRYVPAQREGQTQ